MDAVLIESLPQTSSCALRSTSGDNCTHTQCTYLSVNDSRVQVGKLRWYTLAFKYHHKEIFKGVRLGNRAGHSIVHAYQPIYLLTA